MHDEERFGILIVLRGQMGWKYLGRGRWSEPEWMIEQKRMAEEARRRGK